MKPIITKIILCAVMALTSLAANAQVKEFEKYSDTKNVTYVYISKFMLRLAGVASTPSVPGVDTKSIMHKLSGIQIITSEEKAAAARLKADTQAIIKQGNYDLLMQVDEDDEKVRIYHRNGKQQSVVVMLTEETAETTVIVFSGTFSLEDVMKMVDN
ncbi:MAG: DUF4252 domain-containing protein [Bacteroidaceae bacterium]|nr:DUF4252 domain-containing protein [Bacteroidaceae bacterium]MBR1519873.1 DUF4252 domain-containing protein [Bacteroidaceae bacterium]